MSRKRSAAAAAAPSYSEPEPVVELPPAAALPESKHVEFKGQLKMKGGDALPEHQRTSISLMNLRDNYEIFSRGIQALINETIPANKTKSGTFLRDKIYIPLLYTFIDDYRTMVSSGIIQPREEVQILNFCRFLILRIFRRCANNACVEDEGAAAKRGRVDEDEDEDEEYMFSQPVYEGAEMTETEIFQTDKNLIDNSKEVSKELFEVFKDERFKSSLVIIALQALNERDYLILKLKEETLPAADSLFSYFSQKIGELRALGFDSLKQSAHYAGLLVTPDGRQYMIDQ